MSDNNEIIDLTNETICSTLSMVNGGIIKPQEECDACSNDDTMDTSSICDTDVDDQKLLVEREPIIHLLDLCFPKLHEDSCRWSPESYWDKMKEYTNIDLDAVMNIYNKYQVEEDDNCKLELRIEFLNLIIPAICQLD